MISARRAVRVRDILVQLPELQMLSMTNLRERLLVDRSPLRVSEDGKVLDGANTTCLKVRNTGGGTYCHHDERLFLSSAIGGRPGDNGHKYSLSLTEDRGIGGGWILYPGDVMSAPVPPPPPRRAARPHPCRALLGRHAGRHQPRHRGPATAHL